MKNVEEPHLLLESLGQEFALIFSLTFYWLQINHMTHTYKGGWEM